MMEIYLFFCAFMITATAGNLYMCFKISRIELTSTLTWGLFTLAFFLRFAMQVQSLFYISEIFAFAGGFPKGIVLESTIVEAVIMGSFFIGILQTYLSLRKLGIK